MNGLISVMAYTDNLILLKNIADGYISDNQFIQKEFRNVKCGEVFINPKLINDYFD